jgi:hypothetical protein
MRIRFGTVAVLAVYDLRFLRLHRQSAFCNPRGGKTAAILSSLTSTCRRHEIDPQLYLTQLLINLPMLQSSQFSHWLPDQWKLHHAKKLATFR